MWEWAWLSGITWWHCGAFREQTCPGQVTWGGWVLQVVDVPTKRVGHIAACVGPLVSGSVSPEWLDHHEALGVERFFRCAPTHHGVLAPCVSGEAARLFSDMDAAGNFPALAGVAHPFALLGKKALLLVAAAGLEGAACN